MGAKQSKRSVDISGKEAESGGEVAASIAGGEGRMEPLAEPDALKPQLNGDAHIHETEEKQKEVDAGTPENEKDATTEKETKQQEEEKEAAPLTNGESEPKVENGESTPTPEEGKKPKKEKVKKKWSLRSISFSRKDKPKQEKKSKDEEPKTNGEPEKVPEETVEVATEVPVVAETAEEVETPSEVKEDKTPDTPVTEPITNGTTTPESPKVETPVVEEPAAPSSENETPQTKKEVEPEQLTVNGLSLEEPAKEPTENGKHEDSKEEPTVDSTEIVPEITAKKEVCVEQMPLIDTKPPPLPANPPPSSVVSFAATTMAPELANASLANTADNSILPPPSPPSDPILKDKIDEIASKSEINVTLAQNVSNELSSPINNVITAPSDAVNGNEHENDVEEKVTTETVQVEDKRSTGDNGNTDFDVIERADVENEINNETVAVLESATPKPPSATPEIVEDEKPATPNELQSEISVSQTELIDPRVEEVPVPNEPLDTEEAQLELPPPPPELIEEQENATILPNAEVEPVVCPIKLVQEEIENQLIIDTPPKQSVDSDELNSEEDLPSPPSPINTEDINNQLITNNLPVNSEIVTEATEVVINTNNDTEKVNHIVVEHNNLELEDKNSVNRLEENGINECNGNINIEVAELTSTIFTKESVELTTAAKCKDIPDLEPAKSVTTFEDSSNDDDVTLPPPPQDLPDPDAPQELLPVSDKLADLIPELPEVPELKTETLQITTNESAVAN